MMNERTETGGWFIRPFDFAVKLTTDDGRIAL